jgi:hemerythrin superfamily protein
MDALDFLRNDHERIRFLFQSVSPSAPGVPLKIDAATFKSRCTELHAHFEAHIKAEEEVIYPFFGKFDECQTLITQCYDEHRQARTVMEQLQNNPIPGDAQIRLIEKARSLFDHHIRSEEDELFVQVRKIVARKEMEDLGRLVEDSFKKHLENMRREFGKKAA